MVFVLFGAFSLWLPQVLRVFSSQRFYERGTLHLEGFLKKNLLKSSSQKSWDISP